MLAARPPRLMLQHHRPLSLLLVVLVLILLVGRCSASANATGSKGSASVCLR